MSEWTFKEKHVDPNHYTVTLEEPFRQRAQHHTCPQRIHRTVPPAVEVYQDALERHSPPPIYVSKRSSTSDCYKSYNATERHTTTDRGPKHVRAVSSPLILHLNHWVPQNLADIRGHITDTRGITYGCA